MARLDEIYGTLDEEAFYARIDRSLDPRGPDLLFDIVAGLGIEAGTLVLDAGARDGTHARELAGRFGCRVVALDMVPHRLPRAASLQASIEAIPLAGETVALVWCRDMLGHVPELPRAIGELARVLRPAGHVVLHATFAHDRLEPRETAFLCEALSGSEGVGRGQRQ